ncbi:hypothetical protein TSAR_005924, partial [Trichomalopsis sarcophagae]
NDQICPGQPEASSRVLTLHFRLFFHSSVRIFDKSQNHIEKINILTLSRITAPQRNLKTSLIHYANSTGD